MLADHRWWQHVGARLASHCAVCCRLTVWECCVNCRISTELAVLRGRCWCMVMVAGVFSRDI